MIYSSIIFLLTNHDTMVLTNSYIITIVKDVYQFPQSIEIIEIKENIKDKNNCEP